MDNIYLVGYRATGKTTVGKCLADRTHQPFVDADHILEEEQGQSISSIVEAGGWESFRALEKDLIHRLSKLQGHIIAPGGGAVLDPDNVRRMQQSGLVVWLTATPETIGRRISSDPKTPDQRPALTDQGVLEEITSVLEERTPLYAAAAGLILATDNMDTETVCDRILDSLDELTAQ